MGTFDTKNITFINEVWFIFSIVCSFHAFCLSFVSPLDLSTKVDYEKETKTAVIAFESCSKLYRKEEDILFLFHLPFFSAMQASVHRQLLRQKLILWLEAVVYSSDLQCCCPICLLSTIIFHIWKTFTLLLLSFLLHFFLLLLFLLFLIISIQLITDIIILLLIPWRCSSNACWTANFASSRIMPFSFILSSLMTTIIMFSVQNRIVE